MKFLVGNTTQFIFLKKIREITDYSDLKFQLIRPSDLKLQIIEPSDLKLQVIGPPDLKL